MYVYITARARAALARMYKYTHTLSTYVVFVSIHQCKMCKHTRHTHTHTHTQTHNIYTLSSLLRASTAVGSFRKMVRTDSIGGPRPSSQARKML
jgi:hypothetical protein